jgi:hypothetical protein
MERQENFPSSAGVIHRPAFAILQGELLGPSQDQNASTRRNVWSMRTDDGTDTQILVTDYRFYAL